jgi:hypothetical protein
MIPFPRWLVEGPVVYWRHQPFSVYIEQVCRDLNDVVPHCTIEIEAEHGIDILTDRAIPIIQLVEIEAAFKTMKDDLQLRPIHHQLEQRIEAHIFVAFLAYCLHVTLRARLKPLAPGLTPTAVLDKFAAIQMLDVHFPTTDGRTLILSRYTELTADQKILVRQLKLDLPPQPPPRITAPERSLASQPTPCSGNFRYAGVDIAHFLRRVGKVGLVGRFQPLDCAFGRRVGPPIT